MKATFIKSFMLAIILLITGCSVDGTITNDKGEAIYNATVIASYGEDVSQQVQSDQNGDYHFDIDEGTDVSIAVSKTGYSSQSKSVVVSSNGSYLDFTLQHNGEQIPFEFKEIIGKLVDTDGNPLSGYIQIKNNASNQDINEDGEIHLTKSNNDTSFVDMNTPLVLEFTLYTSVKNVLRFEKIYQPKTYIDANSSSTMNIGDVVVEVGSVKGCALGYYGLTFGLLTYSQPSVTTGISLDNRFARTTTAILQKDKGTFEFAVYKDDKEHTLTLNDVYGNTKTVTFVADSNFIDLTDSCIRVEREIVRDINIDFIVNSSHLLSDVKIISIQDSEITYNEDTPSLGHFAINKNGIYEMLLTDIVKYVEPSELGIKPPTSPKKVSFSLATPSETKNQESYSGLTDVNGTIQYLVIFGLYQGEIFTFDPLF